MVVTTQPPVVDEADTACVGDYRYQMMVRDACIIAAANSHLTALIAGTWAERMAAIRDGHVLRHVFERAYQLGVELFGEEAAQDLTQEASLYADTDARAYRTIEVYGAQWWTPTSVMVRWRFWLNDGPLNDGAATSPWWATWLTRVDGTWQVSFQSFCRRSPHCSPADDPRPDIAAITNESHRPGYDANDDPNRQQVNVGNVPW